MKVKILSLTIAAVGGLFAGTALAQVPVTDIALNTQTTMNQVTNLAKYMQMIAQYKTQIDQLKQQYESLNGVRGLGQILDNPEFKNYLPTEWQDVYTRVQNGGYQGLTGTAQAIRDANALFDTCNAKTGADKTLCERAASKGAQDKAFADEAFDKAKDRLTQIEGLMRQINMTQDPKAIAELQARIAAEGAAIQNEQTKMQLFALASQAEDRLIQQQRREANARTWGATGGGVTAEPLTFGQ